MKKTKYYYGFLEIGDKEESAIIISKRKEPDENYRLNKTQALKQFTIWLSSNNKKE
jgi:hypothetical protein